MTQVHGTSLLRQIRKVVAAQCPSRQSDLALVQQFIAERDEGAFAALLQRHGPMVLGVCRNVLHHQQDAEDVFQAVFMVLARKPHTIRKQQALSSWLHGVAYRLALKARARRARRQDREKLPTEPWSTSTATDDLTVREFGAILHAELQQLGDAFRTPLLLCYWEGKTRDEAAEQIGMTSGAFKKRLERARRLLGNRLTRRGLVPSVALLATLFSESGARAAISNSLIQRTAEAAVAFAAGQQASTTASAAAIALAEGAIRTMNMTRWASTILATILLGGLGTALGLASYQALQDKKPDGDLAAVAGQAQPAPPGQAKQPLGKKSDQERIQGVWRIAKGVGEGKDLDVDFTTLARLTFTKDGKAILTVVENASEGLYKLVGAGKIDIALNPREEFGAGIYKFDGDDRLMICTGKEGGGNKRPTEFTGDKDSGQILFSLTRAKPGEEKPTAEELAKFAGGVDKVRQAAARSVSQNNLKQIGIAMHNYHDASGGLPLHAIYSKDGKTPLLSWRVAILPYIEYEALYKEFKLDQAWDSPHNKKLIAKMPRTYKISIGEQGEGLTYYQVFTGPDTLFNGAKKSSFRDVARGLSNTLMVVEAKDPVIWSKPADLTLPKEKDKMPALGGLFWNGFNFLLCDGSVRMLARDPEPAFLRSIVTPKADD